VIGTGHPRRLVAVVLAGGESRRFGADKLSAEIHGRSLLEHALDELPTDARTGVVGPTRALGHAATFLREEPPGGGPAAALIAGLIWALELDADLIVTLPGDAPSGGRAAAALLAELGAGEQAVVAVDGSGRQQVLQLALRAAAAQLLVELAGPDRGHDQPVRRLVSDLAPRPIPLPADLTHDIDTVEQLRGFSQPEPRVIRPGISCL
jgi:molybdopterin-guanine dinucleotide biosynthesis protein A